MVSSRFPLKIFAALALLVGVSLVGVFVPVAQTVPAPTDSPSVTADIPYLSQSLLSNPPSNPIQNSEADWLYRGSDIPPDDAWSFGVLANGLRYAVRHNAVPEGQVAMRVRIDVGVLAEDNRQRGFAHLLEHLAFRGSTLLPDGDLKRAWQRLGVTIGDDSNAYTTSTQTVYQLDLPSATEDSLEQGVRLLSGMIRSPRLDEAAVSAERAVVLSELREAKGPIKRINDAVMSHFFAGQRLSNRPTIGTEESLNRAHATNVSQFHQSWYRPTRTHIVMVGDAPPPVMASLIEQYFGDWRNDTPESESLDLGTPDPTAAQTAHFYEAGQPIHLSLAAIRPYHHQSDSIAYTHQLYIDYLALLILNRRLEARARRGGYYLSAVAGQEKVSHSADITTVQILPTNHQWQAALADVRSIIADALATPPSMSDISREADEIAALLDKQLRNARNTPGVELADDMIRAIDIGEVVASRASHVQLFAGAHSKATPAVILAATRRLFAAPTERLIATGGVEIDLEDLQQAFDAPVVADNRARLSEQHRSFADLPPLGAVGKIIAKDTNNSIGAETLTFSNGATVFVVNNIVEPDKIRVAVRFGGGYYGAPIDSGESLLWSGDYAFMASGIGDLRQEDIEQLTNGRQIHLNFAMEDDAFAIYAETSSDDVADQLRLIATKLAHPGWDAAPVTRLKIGLLNELSLSRTTPNAMLQRNMLGWLRGGDPRWRMPDKSDIEALTPKKFRAFWEQQMSYGPIEVQLFGDLSTVDYHSILAETIGALPPPIAPVDSRGGSFPAPRSSPQRTYHHGDVQQAAALIAWPTGSGLTDYQHMVRLIILESVVNNRLFNQLRAAEGASYAPIVVSHWPLLSDGGGYFAMASLLTPKDVGLFYDIVESIIQNLRSQAIDEDERARATGPLIEQVNRAMSGNLYWMYLLKGASREPRVITHALALQRDIAEVTTEDLLATARQYFLSDKSWSLVILPEESAKK